MNNLLIINRCDKEIQVILIRYLQEHQEMILIERNPYQADRLMMMLDNEKLDALDKEFHEHPNGIELPNFIWLKKCAISHAPEDKYELVNGLIKLFQDIDINGDGHMEWAEFTQYIIDVVIGSKDAQLYDTRFEKERELTEIEVLDRAYSRKFKCYIPMAQVDDSNHKNPIKNIGYCAQLDNVICLEQNSQHLRFYKSICDGHQNSEILSINWNCKWIDDFETSKLCGVLNTPQPLAEVTALDFADPYPVLVSLQGILISIWNIKTNKCLLRINTNPSLSPMLSFAIFSDISSGPSRQELLPEFSGPLVDKTAQDKKSKLNLQEEQEGLMKDIQQYDTEQHQNKRRALLYMGDQKGYMHIFSLTEFLQRKGITEMENLKKGHSYQLKSKDLIVVSKSVETFLVQEEKQQYPVPTYNISALLIRQWIAHSSAIVKINKVRELVSFISLSMDKHFKIWSMKGELGSDISLAKYDGSNYWKFPFDWVVFDALKLIEKENLSPYEKERVKVRFLILMNQHWKKCKEIMLNLNKQLFKEKKKRLIQSKSQPMNIALKSIAEPYKELTQKMKDDQFKKKKLELSEVQKESKRPQSQHGLVQRLIVAFNDNKDIAKEDGIDSKKKQLIKNIHQKRIQELPQMNPSTSHSKFQQKYQRNYIFIQTQVKQDHILNLRNINLFMISNINLENLKEQ